MSTTKTKKKKRIKYPRATYADLGELCLIAAVFAEKAEELAGRARELEGFARNLSWTAKRLETLRLKMNGKKP